MSKKVIATLKLSLMAQKATPMPPIGPALGQYSVDIASFCKEYNLQTANKGNTIIPVEITIYEDRSYSFILKSTPTSRLLLEAINLSKGSSTGNKAVIGYISYSQLFTIVRVKLQDFNTIDPQRALLSVLGTAKNMGILLNRKSS